MRAAYVTEPGPAEAIRVAELPTPAPGPSDVLVRVSAAAVNRVDTHIRAGRYPTPMPLPFVVGRDLTGVVAEAPRATGFRAGDAVWCDSLGHAGRQGACAEYAVVPAERLYRLPPGADPVEAVAALHPAATAYLGLHRRVGVARGRTILVGGGAGNVGAAVVQLATEAGLRVLATARPADHGLVRDLGAEAVVDYAAPDLAQRVRTLAPAGVDVHWDTSGRVSIAAAADLMATGGTVVVTAGRDPQPATSWWPLYTRDIRVVGFVLSLATVEELASAAAAINRRLAGPGLRVRIARRLPLGETAEAHRLVEAGIRGRVVIHPV